MAFDADGARKAGYSDSEIANHLASQNNFDIEGARKSGYADTEIVHHLTGGNPTTATPAVSPPTGDGEIRQGPAFWKYKVSDLAREGLKAVGLAGGAVAGAAATPEAFGAGAVPGAGLGYATANKAADVVDVALGVSKGKPFTRQITDIPKDFMTGAIYEMGGQLAAIPIKAGASVLKNALSSTTKKAETQAGDLLSKAYHVGPIEAKNISEYQDLKMRNPGLTDLTPAQQMGGRKAGMFEQGLMSES